MDIAESGWFFKVGKRKKRRLGRNQRFDNLADEHVRDAMGCAGLRSSGYDGTPYVEHVGANGGYVRVA